MRVAVVGSRTLAAPDLAACLPPETTEIISGGAKGVDQSAKEYAHQHGIAYTELLPDYPRFGRAAPLKRNDEIIRRAEFVLIFWNGHSRGTAKVIRQCEKLGVPHQVHPLPP